MVFDPHLGALLMFGGCTGTDVAEDPLVPQNDAWVFNARSSTWHQLSPRNAPSPRGWHSMVYATQSGRAVVFGGGASRETPTHEAWIYISRLNGWKNTLD